MAGLNPEEARIFRITHIDNVPWILDHGLHCKSSNLQDPGFIQIGLPELIRKRTTRSVEQGPGGFLGDYVPFYFTPWSIMMYNVVTGHGDVVKRPKPEIVVLVSSIPRLVALNLPFLFTNAHAYVQEADYFDDVRHLDEIDWPLLRSRDFQKNPDDPGKQARYQAEALVHGHVPVEALLGIGCYNQASKTRLEAEIQQRQLQLNVKIVSWYF